MHATRTNDKRRAKTGRMLSVTHAQSITEKRKKKLMMPQYRCSNGIHPRRYIEERKISARFLTAVGPLNDSENIEKSKERERTIVPRSLYGFAITTVYVLKSYKSSVAKEKRLAKVKSEGREQNAKGFRARTRFVREIFFVSHSPSRFSLSRGNDNTALWRECCKSNWPLGQNFRLLIDGHSLTDFTRASPPFMPRDSAYVTKRFEAVWPLQ